MNMKMIEWLCAKAVAIFLILSLLPASTTAGERRPFDLSKIPMDDGWEDTGIMAETIEPCGKDLVYMGLEKGKDEKGSEMGYKLRVRNMVTGLERISAAEPFASQTLIGCTPDSRYMLIGIYRQNIGNSINAYDTETMKMTGAFAYHDEAGLTTRRLSPDGHYLLAGEKRSSFPLPDGRAISVLPLLAEFKGKHFGVAWTADCKTIYLLFSRDKRQKMLVLHLDSGLRQTVELDYPHPDFLGTQILVHPTTGKIYIHVGEAWGFHIVDEEKLFVLDPANLPKGDFISASPKFLGDYFSSLTFGPDNTLLFSLMPDQEADSPTYLKAYNGIFVSNLDGKVIGRVTKNHYELNPQYMLERDTLIVTRQESIFNVGLVNKRIIFRRKPNPLHTPLNAPR